MLKNVLITDDSKLARKIIRKELEACFQSEKITFFEAHTGHEALACIEQESIDLVLLDLTMPEMDGFEVLEKLRELDIDIPIFVLSADVQEGARKRVIELGALEFIPKPIKGETMLEILKRNGIL